MKTLNLHFEDNEHKRLVAKKGKQSWHDFILTLLDTTTNEGDE